MTRTLASAQQTAVGSNDSLRGLTDRAEHVAKRLELLVASMHDLPTEEVSKTAVPEAENATDGEAPAGFRSARGDKAREAA